MSVATLSRSLEGLRDVYGRGMNVRSDVYKLPADAEEHDRLTLQHRIWKLMLSGTGLYPPEVENAIQRLLRPDRSSSEDGNASPTVLDLGSGSGIWVAEMAAMYPHAKVVGIDLAEPKLQKSFFPPNCSFVTTDLTKGLDAYRESFDLVHCRCVAGHLVDRIQLMREIAKVLKPGGLILLSDGNFHLYAPDGSYVLPISSLKSQLSNEVGQEIHGSWVSNWLSQAIGRVISATLDPEHAGGEHIGWLIRQEDQMEFLGEKAYYSPLILNRQNTEATSTEQKEIEEELTRLTGRNISNYLTASRHILLSAGIPEETVDDWLARARAEIHDCNAPETWSMKWNVAWAVKTMPTVDR
ncbi:hypothetical protein ACEPAG_8752 [Sanghuangporus baumii]